MKESFISSGRVAERGSGKDVMFQHASKQVLFRSKEISLHQVVAKLVLREVKCNRYLSYSFLL
jgi:hypothetical protein